jgi:hypothetical protein
MPTGIPLSGSILVGTQKPTDARFGPYASTALALADLTSVYRYKGLTVGIETGGVITEYWFKDGTQDTNFVAKSLDPNADIATSGIDTTTGSPVLTTADRVLYNASEETVATFATNFDLRKPLEFGGTSGAANAETSRTNLGAAAANEAAPTSLSLSVSGAAAAGAANFYHFAQYVDKYPGYLTTDTSYGIAYNPASSRWEIRQGGLQGIPVFYRNFTGKDPGSNTAGQWKDVGDDTTVSGLFVRRVTTPDAGDTTPLALGTASAGISAKYAREDHVHPSSPATQVQADWNETDNTQPDFIKNKPTIPSGIVQSFNRSTPGGDVVQLYRENDFSGNRVFLKNVVFEQEDAFPNAPTSLKSYLDSKIVQADWNETDNTQPDFIKNKPTNFTGSNGTNAGTAGLVPSPAPDANTKFLKGDGTWATVSGGASLTNTAPANLAATAAVGTSTEAARADHVHALPTPADIGAELVWVAETHFHNGLFNKTLPARRKTKWSVTFLDNSPSPTPLDLYLPSSGVQTGDLIDLQFTAPFGRAVNVWFPVVPGPTPTPIVVAGGASYSFIGEATVSSYILWKPTNADWAATSGPTLILNKPTIPAAPTNFTGSNGTNAGTAGLVPLPAATDNTKFLKGDGSWADTPSASLSIGTVQTGAAGSSASASITGTAPSQTLSLTIPQGTPGGPGFHLVLSRFQNALFENSSFVGPSNLNLGSPGSGGGGRYPVTGNTVEGWFANDTAFPRVFNPLRYLGPGNYRITMYVRVSGAFNDGVHCQLRINQSGVSNSLNNLILPSEFGNLRQFGGGNSGNTDRIYYETSNTLSAADQWIQYVPCFGAYGPTGGNNGAYIQDVSLFFFKV